MKFMRHKFIIKKKKKDYNQHFDTNNNHISICHCSALHFMCNIILQYIFI